LILLHIIFESPHHSHGPKAGCEMALLITNPAKSAGMGHIDQPFGNRNQTLAQTMVDVHSPLGIIAHEVFLLPRGAQPGSQKIDLAHGVVAALSGYPLRFFRNHGGHFFSVLFFASNLLKMNYKYPEKKER